MLDEEGMAVNPLLTWGCCRNPQATRRPRPVLSEVEGLQPLTPPDILLAYVNAGGMRPEFFGRARQIES